MAKKTFEGEGNPSVGVPTGETINSGLDLKISEAAKIKGRAVLLTEDELRVLKVLLDRDRTSRLVHGGLKSLLTMSEDDVRTLLNFLDRV